MDYTSTRLSEEMMVPHQVIVKKLKKYAGANKNSSGETIYKQSNSKRLTIVKLGSMGTGSYFTDKSGKNREKTETIYQFAKSDYDTCSLDEARYYEKQRLASVERGKANWDDKSKGLRKNHEKNKRNNK